MKPNPKTRKDVVEILIMRLDECIVAYEELRKDHAKLGRKYYHIRNVMKEILNVKDDADDFKMSEEIPYTPDCTEEVEYDGTTFALGALVEMYDSKARKWTNETGNIVKFCDKMARIKTTDGKKMTTRKYGNFRFALDPMSV